MILYSCHRHGPTLSLAKFDADMNVEATYSLVMGGLVDTCTCPNWPRKQTCKHIRIVNAFLLATAVNSPKFYCYESQTWHQPIQTHDEGEAAAEIGYKHHELTEASRKAFPDAEHIIDQLPTPSHNEPIRRRI